MVRGLHMVNLIGYPGVFHRHNQRDAVLTPTLVEPIHRDPVRNTPHTEAHQHGQVKPGTRVASTHGYLPT